MLFYWMWKAIRALKWLLVMPSRMEVARIRSSGKCAVCGEFGFVLRCVKRIAPTEPEEDAKGMILCQKTCRRCGGRSFEKPVFAVSVHEIFPAIARTPLEEKEDTEMTLGKIYG